MEIKINFVDLLDNLHKTKIESGKIIDCHHL